MTPTNALKTRFEHAVPILSVRDMTVSVRYYVDVLGFRSADWGGDTFTCVNRDTTGIYLCQGGQGQPGTWAWIGVEDGATLFEVDADCQVQSDNSELDVKTYSDILFQHPDIEAQNELS